MEEAFLRIYAYEPWNVFLEFSFGDEAIREFWEEHWIVPWCLNYWSNGNKWIDVPFLEESGAKCFTIPVLERIQTVVNGRLTAKAGWYSTILDALCLSKHSFVASLDSWEHSRSFASLATRTSGFRTMAQGATAVPLWEMARWKSPASRTEMTRRGFWCRNELTTGQWMIYRRTWEKPCEDGQRLLQSSSPKVLLAQYLRQSEQYFSVPISEAKLGLLNRHFLEWHHLCQCSRIRGYWCGDWMWPEQSPLPLNNPESMRNHFRIGKIHREATPPLDKAFPMDLLS